MSPSLDVPRNCPNNNNNTTTNTTSISAILRRQLDTQYSSPDEGPPSTTYLPQSGEPTSHPPPPDAIRLASLGTQERKPREPKPKSEHPSRISMLRPPAQSPSTTETSPSFRPSPLPLASFLSRPSTGHRHHSFTYALVAATTSHHDCRQSPRERSADGCERPLQHRSHSFRNLSPPS